MRPIESVIVLPQVVRFPLLSSICVTAPFAIVYLVPSRRTMVPDGYVVCSRTRGRVENRAAGGEA